MSEHTRLRFCHMCDCLRVDDERWRIIYLGGYLMHVCPIHYDVLTEEIAELLEAPHG